MSRIPTYEFIVGTTKRLTWVSSGTTATDICATIRDRSNALVSSVTALSSGNGHYYAVLTHPSTAGWYVNEWVAAINASTYIDRQFGLGLTLEVS